MEKPRKKEHKEYCGHECRGICDCGAQPSNEMHAAMSTWLEGEVPTKDSIELEIHRYFDKGLKSDKPTNITIDFLAQAIHALLTRKIKGE